MGEIRLLDDRLIDKIAAGEVVENPASVVKELIENSLDASATDVEIEVKRGGKELIRVKDNGSGMSREDAELCVKRHATSKIMDESDLFAIKTLGFRGEALASICAVSHFSIVTRRKQEVAGTRLRMEKQLIIEEAGAEAGTTVKVENLFYNVPARRKFLRDDGAELVSIIDIVTRYALGSNALFSLRSDGKLLFKTAEDLRDSIYAIYGKETAENLAAVHHADDFFKIDGYLGKPNIARNDKTRQNIFINGRYVKSKEIADAIKEGYHSMLFLEREPVYVVKLRIDESKVDVNVHPRKEIVKISNADELLPRVTFAVRDALRQANLIPEPSLGEVSARPQSAYTFTKDVQSTLSAGSVYENVKPVLAVREMETKHIGPFKILGQMNKMYIIAESAEGVLIIDQHAAEERVNYEKLMKMLADKAMRKQKLLKPVVFEVSVAEMELIKHSQEQLSQVGFEVEEYGKNCCILRTVPFIFERVSKAFVSDLLLELATLDKQKLITEAEERIARFSCRMSIKAGEEMSLKQIEELILELDKCAMPFTCPHGRPTIIKITLAEIEKKFKRC